MQEGPNGTAELGAAWKQRSNAGNDYLSVVLDDPSLPQPLNSTLKRPCADPRQNVSSCSLSFNATR